MSATTTTALVVKMVAKPRDPGRGRRVPRRRRGPGERRGRDARLVRPAHRRHDVLDRRRLPGAAERQAHLDGPIAAALMQNAERLLASPPEILPADVLAAKVPDGRQALHGVGTPLRAVLAMTGVGQRQERQRDRGELVLVVRREREVPHPRGAGSEDPRVRDADPGRRARCGASRALSAHAGGVERGGVPSGCGRSRSAGAWAASRWSSAMRASRN